MGEQTGQTFLDSVMSSVGLKSKPDESGNNTTDGNVNNDNNNPNNENNLANNKPFWDNKEAEKGKDDATQRQQAIDPNAPTPDEQLRTHLDSLDLMAGVDASKIQEDLQSGNTDSLSAALSQVSENTYKSSMSQMSKIMDQKIEAATQNAVDSSTASVNANLAKQEMHKVLPFTSDSDIAPVAEGALSHLINNGSSVEEAIKGVENFFAKTAQTIGNSKAPANRTGGNPLGNSGENNNNTSKNGDGSHGDWLDTLTQ